MNYRGAFNTVDFKHQIDGSQKYIITGLSWINKMEFYKSVTHYKLTSL
jgi:hypothetical protein